MERCPACQARLRGESVCGRCRSDLSLAFAAEARAADRLRVAVARLAEGDAAAALDAAEESLWLKRGLLAMWLRDFLKGRRSA